MEKISNSISNSTSISSDSNSETETESQYAVRFAQRAFQDSGEDIQEIDDRDRDEPNSQEREIEEEIPAYTRPPSRVPLAKSKHSLSQERDEMMRFEQERLEREIYELENLPRMTAAQQQAEFAKAVADQTAAKTRREVGDKAKFSMKNSKFIKQAEDDLNSSTPEHKDNVRVMNSYKEKYGKNVQILKQFKFESKGYNLGMSFQKVKDDRRRVELILSTKDAPATVKFIISTIAEQGQKIIEFFNLMEENKRVQISERTNRLLYETTDFDEDVEQLAIKYAPWFELSPEHRVLLKLGKIIFECQTDNPKTYAAPSSKFDDL